MYLIATVNLKTIVEAIIIISPILLPFFSAIVGAFAAFKFQRITEKHANETYKAEMINKLLLIIYKMISDISSIKQIYYRHDLSGQDIQRLIDVPAPINISKEITLDLYKYSFFAKGFKNNKIKDNKWLDLPNIQRVIDLYNRYIKNLEIRSTYHFTLSKKIQNNASKSTNLNEILKDIDINDLFTYIQTTEQFITDVDTLIIELKDMLESITFLGSNLVNKKYLLNKTTILNFNMIEEKINHLLKEIPPGDFSRLDIIMNRNVNSWLGKYGNQKYKKFV